MHLTELTIVLPVHGDSPHLLESLLSIEELISDGCSLLIVDDGISSDVADHIRQWIEKQHQNRIKWEVNQTNLGLFASLNKNLVYVSTPWFAFLCSDDIFLRGASLIIQKLPILEDTGVILSRFKSINEDSTTRFDDCAYQYTHILREGNLLSGEQMLALLLKFGSLNGNLSGMIIRKSLWQITGGFQENWRHASDWEWLVHASERTSTFINQEQLTAIRTHSGQLSNSNLINGHTLYESSQVVQVLRVHPLLIHRYPTDWWAASIMQYHLWNVLTAGPKQWPQLGFINKLHHINDAAPLWLVFVAMIASMPGRLSRRLSMNRAAAATKRCS